MNREQILSNIEMLAKSQGSYGRMLEAINENPVILDELEKQHFKDVVDMVMWLEC